MADDRRRDPRVDVELDLKLAYGSVEEFVERWALNISRGGVFVRTLAPQDVGTRVTLNIELASGERVLRADGVVCWRATPSAPGEPAGEPGMGVRFTRVEPEGRSLIERMVAGRGHLGPDDGPPVPGAAAPAAGAAEAGGARPRPRTGLTVGIDLGTTNSCVAFARDGRAEVLLSRGGHRTIPSVVAFDEQGRLLVGQAAKAQMIVNPRDTVHGAKRLVGRPFQSPTVQACRDRFHYEIVEGTGGEAAVRFAGREFTLKQVQAFVLRSLRQSASDALGEKVGRAVITVPAHYGDAQRQAVRDAGALAGLEVVRILNEPTAAALAYGYGRSLDRRVLVYDLGGGTFDASLLDVEGDVYEVLATGGDTFLGGADFDSQVVDHLAWRFAERYGFAPPRDPVVWQRIRDAAEEVKIALSSRDVAIASAPFLCKTREGGDADLKVEVSRALLEEITEALVDRTVALAREVVASRILDGRGVEDVLLVGGQSRMPLVWRKIREAFGVEPNKGVHPDEAVAIGAALLADSDCRIDSVVLIDVLPVGIGVGLPGGRVAPIFPRNTRLPAKKSYEVSTTRDGQGEIELAVFQGDRAQVAECDYLGTVRVERLPPAPRGAVRISLEFHLGAEGILSARARNLATGEVTRADLRMSETPDSLRRKLAAAAADGPTPAPSEAAAIPSIPSAAPVAVDSLPQPRRRGFIGRILGRR